MRILKRRILSVQQQKKMDFDYCEEYLRSISNKKSTFKKSVKKSTFSFSCDLQIDKKINNVKEDRGRKTDSNFDFS